MGENNYGTISATELARTLSDVLNRVKYRGDRFLVERNGEAIASLGPAPGQKGITARELIAKIGDFRFSDPDFADDLEEIRRQQGYPPKNPWD